MKLFVAADGRLRDQRRGLAGWEYPMTGNWCYQDVDGDGLETRDKRMISSMQS